MPLVEVLTTSSSHATPGWAYVPDTRFNPSNIAIKSTTGRKRGIREPGGRADLTSRQNTAIIRHLAELDRENHRDVSIPVPVKKDVQKDGAGRVARSKTTSNVRRILQSQKTFRNYLDDEEAALAQAQHTTTAFQRTGASKIAKTLSRRSATPVVPKAEQQPLSRKQQQQRGKSRSTAPAAQPAPTQNNPQDQTREPEKEPGPDGMDIDKNDSEPLGLIKTEYENDPLLRSYIPSAPSERIMQALLSEPPLTYNASRAGPSATNNPPRFFCTICGYWGKIRCRNCGVRTCGLDCYKVHEDSRCGAFF